MATVGSKDKPMIVKDLAAVEKTTSAFKNFTQKFTEEHKLQREYEQQRAKVQELQLTKQKEETKKLIDKQDRLNQTMYEMQQSTEDGQRSNEEHLRMVRQAFGNFSEEAKATQKEMEKQGDKFDPQSEKNMVQNTDMLVKFQEQQIHQAQEIENAKKTEENLNRSLDEEKRREAGVGQKMIIKSLNKMGGWMKGMWETSKKAAVTGLKGAFITLGIMALLRFMESPTWKRMSESIKKWIEEDKLGKFWKYLWGPADKEGKGGGLFTRLGKVMDAFIDPKTGEFDLIKGVKTMFKELSSLELLIGGLALALILPKGLTLLAFKASWKLVTGSLGLLMGLFRGIKGMITKDTTKLKKDAGIKDKKKPPKAPAKGPDKVTPGAAKGGPDKVKPTTPAAGQKPKGGQTLGKAKTAAKAVIASGTGGIKNAAGKIHEKFTKGFVHLKKYPLLMKAARRIPLLGPVLSSIEAIQLMMGDATHEQKVKGMGRIIGSGVGSAGFAIIGGKLGLLAGPGAVAAVPLGALIGSVAGWAAGGWMGGKLAEFLMGDSPKVDAPKGTTGGDANKAPSSGAPTGAVKPKPFKRIEPGTYKGNKVSPGLPMGSNVLPQSEQNATADKALAMSSGSDVGGAPPIVMNSSRAGDVTHVVPKPTEPLDGRFAMLSNRNASQYRWVGRG